LLYSQAVEYMSQMEKFGSVYGLDTVKSLLHRLGNPQNSLKFIHIAGTNGKGSTSCFISNILISSGYKVGTFNSPSVFGYNERFLIDGRPIDDESVAKYVSAVADERQRMKDQGANLPTAFELEFAIAMLYFKDSGCDIAVLECGLGGRLDATNAIPDKEIAVITSISYDHTAILGNTLGEIAAEKAAIVKDCPLVTFRQCEEVMHALSSAKNIILCDEATLLNADRNGQTFEYKGCVYNTRQLGKYQLQNCSLAIECALQLRKKGYRISDQNIIDGVANSLWKGRLQKVEQNGKLYILDGTHNPDGARALSEELQANFSDEKKCFVFGMFADKDVDGVLSHIGKIADEFLTVKPPSARGLSQNAMLDKCIAYNRNSIACDSISQAIRKAEQSQCSLVVICGSLSLLKDALETINTL